MPHPRANWTPSSPSTSSFSNVMKAERSPTQPATDTRSRRLKPFTPNRDYRNSGQSTLVIFDLRDPGAMQSMFSEHGSSGGRTSIERLDRHHLVLIHRPHSTRGRTS